MKILRRFDLLLLVIISFTAILITVIDTFDLFSLSELFHKEINYNLICLLFLSFIAGHLVVRFISEEDYNDRSLKKIDELIASSDNIKIRVFEESFELETYLAKRIHEAKKEICDLTWKLSIESGYGLGKRKDSQSIYDKAIASVSAKLIFKEIWVFSDPRRLERFNRRIKENKEGYSCRYFRDESNKIPRMQFVIIDDDEVIFFSISKNSLMCSIRGEAICRIFKPYFLEAWHKAIVVKDGRKVVQTEIDYINKTYNDLSE